MKKIVSFLLVAVMVLSFGATVLAAGSPSAGQTSGTATAPLPAQQKKAPGVGLYDSNGEKVGTVPANKVKKTSVANAGRLSDEDRETFLAVYEQFKAEEGKVVKYFYWLDIPEEYKSDDIAYYRYEFTCTGKNVQLFVNGKEMEIEKTGKNAYAAKLTEFGAVAILCDKAAKKK